MKLALFGLVAVMAAFLIYVRFGPEDVSVYHRIPVAGDVDDVQAIGGFIARRDATASQASHLDKIIQNSPRTERISGSIEEGLVTYRSRTRWIGFPDYINLAFGGGEIIIEGRLRFGRSDIGVNRKRIESWLEAAGLLTQAP